MAERNNPKCCPKCGAHNNKIIITQGLEICDPVRMGRTKVSDSFNDTLRGIRDANHGSTIELRK